MKRITILKGDHTMKMPTWWNKPITWRDNFVASLIGGLVGFILWIGMVLYEKYEFEIQEKFESVRDRTTALFGK